MRQFVRQLDGDAIVFLMKLLLSMLLLCSFAQPALAQDVTPLRAPQQDGAATPPHAAAPRRSDPANLLLQLNLSPEQRAQLVEIRRQSASEGQALVRRLNQARRTLDAAIYADNVDEAVVEDNVREVAAAQSAVVRMRALTELRVRRVLTPEQLEMFRQLRREELLRLRLERRVRRAGTTGEAPPLLDNHLSPPSDNPPSNTARPNVVPGARRRRPLP